MKKRTGLITAALLSLTLLLGGCTERPDVESILAEIGGTRQETKTESTERSSESTGETAEGTETEPETETESETEPETETETETGEEPIEEEKPAVLHLLRSRTERYNWMEDANGSSRPLCQMYMDDVSLMQDESLLLYPELLEALEKNKLDRADAFESLHAELLQAAGSAESGQSSYRSLLTFGRTDSSVLSFSEDTESYYARAARPWRHTEVWNLDSAAGSALGLSEFVSDTEGFTEVLRDEVRAYIREITDSEEALLEIDYFFEDIPVEEMPFTVGYDRLSFYFDSGDVLPNAFPSFRIDVLFSGNERLFKERTLNVPEDYVIRIPGDSEEPFRLSDGRVLSVSPAWSNEERYWFNDFTVSTDGESVECDVSGESVGGLYLMHTAAHGDFLYVACNDFNGYGTTVVLDLNGKAPAIAGSYGELVGGPGDYDGEYGDGESRGIYTEEVVTDPARFTMRKPMQMLSTYTGSRAYGMGEDGLPKSLEYWYQADIGHILTLLQDLEADVLDENGEVTGTRFLPAGEQITISGANPEDRKVRFLTEDGTVIVLQLERDEVNHRTLIRGIDVDELFDGMMFAG